MTIKLYLQRQAEGRIWLAGWEIAALSRQCVSKGGSQTSSFGVPGNLLEMQI